MRRLGNYIKHSFMCLSFFRKLKELLSQLKLGVLMYCSNFPLKLKESQIKVES